MRVFSSAQAVSHILLIFFLFYAAYCGLLFLLQRHILFPYRLIATPSSKGVEDLPEVEKIWIDTRYGKIESWFLPPETKDGTGPRPAIIFAHGNGELIDSCPEQFRDFTRSGIGVLLVEYPGYGRSEGTPSEKTIKEAFVRAYDMLIARKEIDASRIVLFGRSLGGGAVCTLAAERPSAGLILMSTFTSVRSFASRYFAPAFLVRDPFDNLTVVRSYPGPILVIHGNRDDLISYEHGLALYRAARRGTMVTYNCAHNDCPPDWALFRQDVERFFHGAGILSR